MTDEYTVTMSRQVNPVMSSSATHGADSYDEASDIMCDMVHDALHDDLRAGRISGNEMSEDYDRFVNKLDDCADAKCDVAYSYAGWQFILVKVQEDKS